MFGKNWKRDFPLHHAAFRGDIVAIEQLIVTDGVDPNVTLSKWFNTHTTAWAACQGHLRALILLIQLGADPFWKCTGWSNAMRDAKRDSFS